MSDFEIKDGVLVKYCGSGESVVVPDGVVTIGPKAFWDAKTVREVFLPEGLAEIGKLSFCGLEKLRHVEFPSTLRVIGMGAFASSFDANGLELSIDSNVLVLPEGLEELGNQVFECSWLTKVTLPSTLKRIGDDLFYESLALTEVVFAEGSRQLGRKMFSNCESLQRVVLPSTIESIAGAFASSGYGVFTPKAVDVVVMPDAAKRMATADQLNPSLTICLPEDCESLAYVLAFQNHANWMKAIDAKCSQEIAGEVLEKALSLLSGKELTAKKASQLVDFALIHLDSLDPSNINDLHGLLKDGGRRLSKALVRFEGDPRVELSNPVIQEKELAPEVEPLVASLLVDHHVRPKLKTLIRKGLPLANGSGISSPEAVQLLVELCVVPKKGVRTVRYSSTDYHRCNFLSERDELGRQINELAALLDRDALSECLVQLFYDQHTNEALVALCRFGNDDAVKRLAESMKAWDEWDGNGSSRKVLAIARGALLYNDSIEAMRHFESRKMLNWYALVHGTTEDALRDNTLSDFGFDPEGRRVFDLGSKTVTATIGDDLKIALYDDGAGKVVKSIPKRGADPEKVETAKAELADMRKGIRTVVRQRKDLLFEDFLTGRERRVGAWKDAYLGNPVLRSVARLIVWQKGDVTFTVLGGSLVDASGSPIKLPAGGIKVAHPVEMKKADVDAWRAYFATRGLKQPFAQVWEKVVPKSRIKRDRYVGYPIPVYRFKGQNKHGIHLDLGEYNDVSVKVSFDYDTALCVVKQLDFNWHDLNNRVEIISFSPVRGASPRKLNHLVACLDRMCFYPRLASNDLTVMDDLNDPTLEQLIDYTRIASENGATELAAALLAYREERFPEYGSVESLLL